MRLTLVLLLIAFFGFNISAQNKKENLIQYTLTGIVVDSEDSVAVIGALVSIITDIDTLHTQTDVEGHFHITIQNKPKSIEVVSLGYGITRKDIDKVDTIQDLGTIKMNSKAYHLDEVTVKARLRKVTYRGDTIQFNANALQMKKWDTAGDLLEKLPGLNVNKKQGSVSYEGKDVKRAYVDGKLVFGEGTGNLMEYMDAKDINTIDLYEELSDENKYMGNTNAQKDWVMNFKTYNQLVGTSVAQIDGSYGRDQQHNIDNKIQERYAAGATINDFSEKRQITFKYLGNNVNRETSKLDYVTTSDQLKPGYNRDNVLDMGVAFMKNNMYLNTRYSYNNEYSRNNNRSERIYTPTDDFYSRLLSDTSFSVQRSQIHNVNIMGYYNFKRHRIDYDITNSFTNNDVDNTIFNSNIKDDLLISRMRSLRSSNNNGFSGDYRVSPSFSIKPGKLTAGLNTIVSVNTNKNEEVQVDTTFQDIYKYSDINTYTKNRGISISTTPRIGYNIFSTLSITGSIRLFTQKSDKTKNATDNYINQTDSTRSYDFDDLSRGISPQIMIMRQKKNHLLTLTGQWNWTWISQKNRGEETFSEKLFQSPTFSLRYTLKNILKNKKNSAFLILYNGQAQTPSPNMLQSVVDNNNPMYLRSGNEKLKQAYTNRISSELSWHEEDRYIRFALQGLYSRNRIVPNKTLFFDTETVLENYNNYIVPAGSMLSIYDNIKNTYTIGTNINYHVPVYLIYSNLKSNISYNYTGSSEFVNIDLIRTKLHSGSLTLDLKSDFSHTFEIGVKSKTNYYHMVRSNHTKNRILEENIEASIDTYLFDDRLFLSAFYRGAFMRNIDFDGSSLASNIINFTVGSKLLHRRNAEISISAFDILNKNRNYTSRANSAHLINSWNQISGRYFMVNFSYQFKIKRTQKKLK